MRIWSRNKPIVIVNKGLLKSIIIFLGVLGPSVITTMAGNDGAGVITYAAAGAQLGYAVTDPNAI